ncbi:PstS family phosphate ABC transporter substrate-binding protein [Thermus caldifontis]|uniref:PstS family phosphate ABC transporter substrate-binding protein n=1 Tax=Thermus caldifontis TaxID=1930763 RepID=UPI000DF3B8ED|nr:PstS family phosphate ABC transporter substrate-binding protein [Thermus caldifontis]
MRKLVLAVSALVLASVALAQIRADGSSTVYPITQAVAEEFTTRNPQVKVTVAFSGTGGGFKKFCRGETDIQDASRPILPEELKVCKENKVEFIELPVAYDALTVIVNPRNTWAACMRVSELKAVWEPGSKITRWNQIRPQWPNQPLRLFGAGADSGTFDYFTEAIVGKLKAIRTDYQPTEDDNVTIKGVAGDLYAMGFLGVAYYEENKDKVKAIAIDNGKGCVLPTRENVLNGSYQPLARPLFIYVNVKSLERKEVQDFVNFYLSPAARRAIRSTGYIELPDEAYKIGQQLVAKRKTGTFFMDLPVGTPLSKFISELEKELK